MYSYLIILVIHIYNATNSTQEQLSNLSLLNIEKNSTNQLKTEDINS